MVVRLSRMLRALFATAVFTLVSSTTGTVPSPAASPDCTFRQINSTEPIRNGPGCQDLAEVSAPLGCPLPPPPNPGPFDQDQYDLAVFTIRLQLRDGYVAPTQIPADGFVLRFRVPGDNGSVTRDCGCYYIPSTALPRNDPLVFFSDPHLQTCAQPYGGPDATFQRQLSGEVTSLPVRAGSGDSHLRQTKKLPPLLLNSCVNSDCQPTPCYTKCVPAKPIITMTRLNKTSALFLLRTLPVPVGTAQFSSYSVLVSARNASRILCNITSKLSVKSHPVAIPDDLAFANLTVKAWISATRVFNSMTYKLVGSAAVRYLIVLNGTWSSWQQSGSCPATCGNATVTEKRHCKTPVNGGLACPGNMTTRVVSCKLPQCQVYQWGSWRAAGDCGQDCRRRFVRQCRKSGTGPVTTSTCMSGGDETSQLCCKPDDRTSSLPAVLVSAIGAVLAAAVIAIWCGWRRCSKKPSGNRSSDYRLQADLDEGDEALGNTEIDRCELQPLTPSTMTLEKYVHSELKPRAVYSSQYSSSKVCIYISHDRQSPLAVELAWYLGKMDCAASLDILSQNDIPDMCVYSVAEKWLDQTLNWNAGVNSDHRERCCQCNQGVGGCPHIPNFILFLCTPALKCLFDNDNDDDQAAALGSSHGDGSTDDAMSDHGISNGIQSFLRVERGIAESLLGHKLQHRVACAVLDDGIPASSKVPGFLLPFRLLLWCRKAT